ncbi:carbohydrate ABC transporter permease [Rhizobium sp. L1K21]|uniref:carbohydrate ABC transporter permease n=1 Tax=Rhizobium sp. L1K21 TaxID=2954933 RepID=UPI002092228B|nr:sugar ABC transporter permease [Rhizobium sp. L1K21]MCO6187602.1 sugar ABC transporter permease [Rhizobium sp. L1K21]
MSTAALQPVLARPIRRSVRRIGLSAELLPWLYILPAVLAFGVWIYEPLIRAFMLSFYEWNMLPFSPQKWVGTQNYSNIFALQKLWQALGNTAIYVVGLLPMSVAIPLAVAIFTHDLKGRWRNFYRALIFVPMIIAPVVAAAVWRWLLDPQHGILNLALQGLGIAPIDFLGDPNFAIWTIILITGWKLIGFATLILSAANANINPSLIEAARMDGASSWEIVRDIRLPLLSSTALFLVMMTILLGAQWSFTYINVLTAGGPLGSTTNIYYLLWDFGFSSMSVGWSSAAAVVLFVGFSVIAFGLFRMIERYSFYDN